MKRLKNVKIAILCALFLSFFAASAAVAAPWLSDFPIGTAQADAIAKGVVMQDERGGTTRVSFGGKEWNAALIFENKALAYIILNGDGADYISAADEGLWQLGWLIIYAATDRDIVFDAVKLSASGLDEDKIGEAYEKFQEDMQKQKFTRSMSVYISERVWITFRNFREGNPIEKFPDAVVCNIATEGNKINVVLSTFGYIEKMRTGAK